ncbi:MAG: sugar ABC transporter substrate-binding protein [Lachnospiraceae bacterium]|nr:sugar ABC transporter substrate-binding protein [Lachnospiraceae bacterium]
MKKNIAVILAAVLLLASVTACGKKEGPAGTDTTAAPAQQSGTAAPAEGGRSKIQVMGPWVVESPEDQILAGVVEGFEAEHPEYEVELIGVPSADLLTNVQSMAASATLPDLVITNGANNAAWKEMDIISDIRGEFDQSFLDGFYPEMLKEFTYNDELFGLPTCAAPFVLLLREDLLKEAGLDVPESFDEIVQVARELTVDLDGDGKIDRYGMSLMGFPDSNNALRFTLALFAAGAPDIYADENGKWATKIGSEDGVRAFKLYYDLAIRDGSVPKGATEVDYKTMVNLLATDQVAMAISGPHTIGNIVVQNPEMEGKFIAVPLKDKHTVAYLNPYGMIMFKDAPNKEGAVAFLQYAAENFVEMTRVTKRPPSRIELEEVAREAAPEVAAILDCARYNIDYVAVPFRGEEANIVAENVNAMLAGSISSPEEAARLTAEAVQAVLDANN